VRRGLAGVLRVALSGAAIFALWRELRDLSITSLAIELRGVGAARISLGIAFTTASFLLLGLVELLALRRTDDHSGDRVPLSAGLTTAFVANALSQSIGIALLTGAAVRARAYARRGLDGAAVAQVTAFVTLTATLGLLAAGSVALLTAGIPIAEGPVSFAARPTALLLALIVAAYLVWSVAGRGDGIGRGRWRIARPTPALAFGQVLISAFDWIITAVVLYVYMPTHAGLTFGVVLSAYMIAQTAGVTSHVPAGTGVLELVAIALLMHGAPSASREGIVVALVMFRLTYYLLPLCVASVVAIVAELRRARRGTVVVHATERMPSHERVAQNVG
jgi:uncharacterized membrane protein YbhN (UPF0104 family)